MTENEQQAKGITISRDVSQQPSLGAASLPVDPWRLQHSVMAASSQPTPAAFTFSYASLTYLALILEEVGETLTGAVRVMDMAVMPPDTATNILANKFVERTSALRGNLRATAEGLKHVSKNIRAFVANPNNFALDFSKGYDPKAVEELLDGVTDVMVVAAGLSVASGMPGAAAFLEVCGSNLSKRNPATGMIDLDPTGKWIKGPDYWAPKLESLIRFRSASDVPVVVTHQGIQPDSMDMFMNTMPMAQQDPLEHLRMEELMRADRGAQPGCDPESPQYP